MTTIGKIKLATDVSPPSLTLPKFARSKISAPQNINHDNNTIPHSTTTPKQPAGLSGQRPKQIKTLSYTSLSEVRQLPKDSTVVLTVSPSPIRSPAQAIVNGITNTMPTVIEPAFLPEPTPPRIARPGVIKSKCHTKTPALLEISPSPDTNIPKTPLIIPKIGIKFPLNEESEETSLKPGENPWILQRSEKPSDVKIAAITPIGTIAMVPTIDKRPPVTPRHIVHLGLNNLQGGQVGMATPGRHLTLRVIDETTGVVKIDPILTASIYLDCTKPEDQAYDHVANKMRNITQNMITLQKQYTNVLKPLLNVSGRVSHSIFEEALSIYENNQVYYQDRIDDHSLDIPTIRARLTELEQWFMCIIEPRATDDLNSWREREQSKLIKGVSTYCDPELYPYISPLPAHIRSMIQQYQIEL